MAVFCTPSPRGDMTLAVLLRLDPGAGRPGVAVASHPLNRRADLSHSSPRVRAHSKGLVNTIILPPLAYAPLSPLGFAVPQLMASGCACAAD